MKTSETEVRSILTRSSGFLRSVCSHSLQPYRGCTFGRSLCGAGCYARHNIWLTRGAEWGSFLEVRRNAPERYREQFRRERDWARRAHGQFAVFMSSSTDPFVPQEQRYRVTERILQEMIRQPPDRVILQTHSHRVTSYLELYRELSRVAELKIHISIETDRPRLPGLPRPASLPEQRLAAAAELHAADQGVVVTVAPLLPIERPRAFFERVSNVATAVVIDHFIGGDGSADGARTRRTSLPAAMAAVDPGSVKLAYRERMVALARSIMPGRVGVSIDGFAGRYLP